MDILATFFSILQTFSVSLGVGTSTVVITQFLAAISNGNITKEERKMLGVDYILLRIAMCGILFTTLLLSIYSIFAMGMEYFTSFVMAIWTLIFVLFLNAFLMSKHIMPSKFGPAVQAGTWYMLGILFALIPISLTEFSYIAFLAGYIFVLALAILGINGVMKTFKKRK